MDFRYQTIKNKLIPYLFLLPGLALLGAFFFVPIVNTFRYSFYKYDLLTTPRFLGFENYINLWSDGSFTTALFNTLKYSIIVVPSLIVISFFLALLVNQQLKFIKIFRVIYYLPRIMSLVVASLIWKLIFQSDGLLNSILRLIGLNAVGWLSNPKIALFSLALVTIWVASGYYMIIYLAGLQSIPLSMLEAGMIDGASDLQRLWYLIIPFMKPHILTVTLTATIGAMRVFGEVFLITAGGPGNSTDVLTHFIYVQAFDYMKMGYSSAAASVLLLILIVVSAIYMYLFSKGGVS